MGGDLRSQEGRHRTRADFGQESLLSYMEEKLGRKRSRQRFNFHFHSAGQANVSLIRPELLFSRIALAKCHQPQL